MEVGCSEEVEESGPLMTKGEIYQVHFFTLTSAASQS